MSTSLELTAMKLNAFIDSVSDVNVTHQEHGHVKMRLGSVGFMTRWGNTPERQAVEMDVRFETTRETRDSGEAKTRRSVNVVIAPVGKAPDQATFELRCLQGVLQQRNPRHRTDTARNRGYPAGDLLHCIELHISVQLLVLTPSDTHVYNNCSGFDPFGRNQTWFANGRDHNICTILRQSQGNGPADTPVASGAGDERNFAGKP